MWNHYFCSRLAVNSFCCKNTKNFFIQFDYRLGKVPLLSNSYCKLTFLLKGKEDLLSFRQGKNSNLVFVNCTVYTAWKVLWFHRVTLSHFLPHYLSLTRQYKICVFSSYIHQGYKFSNNFWYVHLLRVNSWNSIILMFNRQTWLQNYSIIVDKSILNILITFLLEGGHECYIWLPQMNGTGTDE